MKCLLCVCVCVSFFHSLSLNILILGDGKFIERGMDHGHRMRFQMHFYVKFLSMIVCVSLALSLRVWGCVLLFCFLLFHLNCFVIDCCWMEIRAWVISNIQHYFHVFLYSSLLKVSNFSVCPSGSCEFTGYFCETDNKRFDWTDSHRPYIR